MPMLSDYERRLKIRIGALYTLKPGLIRSVISYVNKDERNKYYFSLWGPIVFEMGEVVLAVEDCPEKVWLVCLYGDKLVAVKKGDIQEVENET